MKKRKLISAKKDFSIDQLPQTRKDQFFNIFKNQYMTIFKSGLILLLFFIPFLLVDLFKNYIDAGFYSQLAAGKLTENEYNYCLFIDLMIQTGAEFLLLPLLAVPFAGLNNIFKTMVEGEFVIYKDDFKEGVKSNYKITLIILLVFGLIFALTRFLANYFIGVYWIIVPLYMLLILFTIPIAIIGLLFSSYYQGNYFNVISNSSKLYPTYWWKYLIISILIFGFIFTINLTFDGNILPYFKTILYGGVILFIVPILLLIIHSISISMFDKCVNSIYYVENQYKGLYNPKSISSKKHIK